ncbi:MAG: septal ring lytic transglycosylase RlpA family protein [Rhodospirillales bacterium]
MAGNWERRFLCLMVVLLVAGCAETQLAIHGAKRLIAQPDKNTNTKYKIGKPYQIAGVWYYPAEDFKYDESGIASWYGTKFHGRKTANGEIYDMNALTAAHRTLPMPSYVRVTNLENGRSLILRVNDRGPFARGRIIDISRRGSQLLNFQKQGTARVRVQVLADQSRTLKSRITNQAELAKTGSPITIDRLPKAKVQAQSLAPVGGAKSAPQPITLKPIADVAPQPVAEEPVVTEKIHQSQVVNTNIFVQAGAFSRFDNANKVRARLSPLGPVKLNQVLINGRDLYRVRVGPMENVGAADLMLASVSKAGYPESRIIVEK